MSPLLLPSISALLLFITYIIFIIMSNERDEIIQHSGPDGDYMEKDIKQIQKGKAIVSLRLIPDGGVLHLSKHQKIKTSSFGSRKHIQL